MRVQTKEIRIWLDRKDSHEQFIKKVWADILALGLNNQIDISNAVMTWRLMDGFPSDFSSQFSISRPNISSKAIHSLKLLT